MHFHTFILILLTSKDIFYLFYFNSSNLYKKINKINPLINQSHPPHNFPHYPFILLITPNLFLPYPKIIYQHPQLFRYHLTTIELLFYLCFVILESNLFVLYRLFFQVLINSPTLSEIKRLGKFE